MGGTMNSRGWWNPTYITSHHHTVKISYFNWKTWIQTKVYRRFSPLWKPRYLVRIEGKCILIWTMIWTRLFNCAFFYTFPHQQGCLIGFMSPWVILGRVHRQTLPYPAPCLTYYQVSKNFYQNNLTEDSPNLPHTITIKNCFIKSLYNELDL